MIRRALALSPIAAFATGCVSRPWTPSVDLAYWAQEPDVRATALPSRDDAMRRWQLPPADPWAPYAKYTLVSAIDSMPGGSIELPDVDSLDDVQRARAAALRIAQAGLPPGTLFVVDMRGAASVAFGVALSKATDGRVSLVPTFNNWPADDELVPAEETLAAMATMAPYVDPDAQGTTPVFLLDAWRLAYRFDSPGDDTYDNRYILTTSDLPDAATLRSRGIVRVVYVVHNLDDTAVEEDDLHPCFMDWQSAGIRISMVDLDVLERPLPPQGWGVVFDDEVLLVQPRVTIIDEPGFYMRAHGGFGGIHARPGVHGGGAGWIFHGGWGGLHGGGG
jgi:hypothetical protein